MLITYTPSQRECRDGSPWRLLVTWVRIDQDFADHPKVLAVGPLGGMLQVRALCYCARHLTDGFVPERALPTLTADMDLGADAMRDIMVGAGLWDPADGGFQIHDYLTYNPSREIVLAEREHRQSLAVKGGIARAMNAKRNGNGTMASSRESSRAAGSPLVQPHQPGVQPESSPDPDPVRERDQLVTTPKIQSDPRASRSTRRRFKSKKPGSFGRL